MPVVTRVRKETSRDGTHQHIAGVCTQENYYYTRARVIAGLNAGQLWQTLGGGRYATIRPVHCCPAVGCFETPYITTDADAYAPDNLDNLPAC